MTSDVEPRWFWDKVARGGDDECWPWQGALSSNRYGSIRVRNRTVRAHRFAFEAAHRPLAPGEVVRHKCDNPRCCNPAHLEPGTHTENMGDMIQRGRWKGVAADNASATHCKRGHLFDDENTQRRGDWRICRQCNRDRQAAMRAALAAFTAAPDGATFAKVNGKLERTDA